MEDIILIILILAIFILGYFIAKSLDKLSKKANYSKINKLTYKIKKDKTKNDE